MFPRLLASLLSLSLVLATCPLVHAGEAEDAVGKMHYDEGQRLYKAEKFEDALREFTKGYEASKRPAFLLNMAQSHRKLGQLEKARSFYKAYLHEDPKSQLADAVTKLIEEIDLEIAATKPPDTGNTVVTPPPTVPDPPQHPPKRIFTWVGAAFTVASLGTAIGLQVAAYLKFQELNNYNCNGQNPDKPQDAYCTNNLAGYNSGIDRVASLQNGATGMFIVTGVFAVGTVIAAIVETRAIKRASRPSASLGAGPGTVGLGFNLSF